MASSFAVIGPGKVGQALARRWREAGYALLGFVGTDVAAAAQAVRFAGGGRPLEMADLGSATFVLVSVPDSAIAEVAARAARVGAVRKCALWLHTSGVQSTAVLEPVALAGARVGSLHPLGPFATAEDGYRGLEAMVAVLDGSTRSLRLLRVLARAASLSPVELGPTDRVLYHAACALAANGATVLHALATKWFAAAVPDSASAAPRLAASLMQAALAASQRLGSCAALTGPATRGDVATLTRHLRALAARDLPGRAVFATLMGDAARLARARGDLTATDLAHLLAALEPDRRG